MSSRFLFSISAALLAGTVATAATITPVEPIQSEGCYQISTAEELYGFAEIVNGNDSIPGNSAVCGELLNDIVVNENVLDESGRLNRNSAKTFVTWIPMVGFSGTFNGNGHVISGLYSATKSGLFESISSWDSVVVVKNLGIVDSYFSPSSAAGVLTNNIYGKAEVRITNFYTLSTIETPKAYLDMGAITGYLDERAHLTVTNCYNAGLFVDSDNDFYSSFFDKRTVFSTYPYVKISNSYTLKRKGIRYVTYGALTDSAAFSNGAVAYALREGEGGSIWGQIVGKDKYPGFSGRLVNTVTARYNVTFHTFEGDTASYFDSYISGFNVALPEKVEQENMYFGGWYRSAEFSGTPDTIISDTAKGDLEYWAKLNRIYKITYHTDGGFMPLYDRVCTGDYEPMDDYTGCYISGEGKSLRWPSRDSSIFLGWYDNEELTGNPVDSVGPDETGDKDFYAKWFNLKRPPIDPADSCYEISDVAELYGFSALVNGEFAEGEKRLDDVCGKLTQDIVVNKNVLKENGTLDSAREEEFFPWNTINLYNGFFDGQGHTISGLYANEAVFYAYAPEPYDYTKVTIRNLKVKDTFVYGYHYAAGIISSYSGYRPLMEIDNTHFDGAIYLGHGCLNCYIGGLVSYTDYVLIIKNSSHRGIISILDDSGYAGGLVGYSDEYMVLLQNSNEGRFDGGAQVGGLVGEISGEFFIANNYNAADIVCNECDANGLIGGYFLGICQSFVLNNYSSGLVSGSYGAWLKDYCVTFENNYYLTGTSSIDGIGTEVEALDFANGTVATALYNYVQKDAAGIEIVGGATGDKWIQGSKYPIFFENETRSVIRLFEYDVHKPLPTIALLYTPGQTLPLPTPTAKGYDFLGWYYDSNLITEIPATASGYFVIAPKWQKHVSSSSIASSSSVAPPGPANSSSSVAASSSSEAKISSSSSEVNSSSAMSSSSEKSSSSSAKSSSSIKSSSSNVKSSSSTAKSSSSSVKGKSSSSKAKSSSSKAKSSSSKAKSSSSKGKDAIVAAAQVPQFMLTAVGRDIQVAGARVGSTYAVLDMQGRVIAKGRVAAANFNLTMDRSATYLVRIGYQTQRVVIRGDEVGALRL